MLNQANSLSINAQLQPQAKHVKSLTDSATPPKSSSEQLQADHSSNSANTMELVEQELEKIFAGTAVDPNFPPDPDLPPIFPGLPNHNETMVGVDNDA
ncbi:hypothetical protein [Leptothoe spongobia]|uniref:Uncharacterized protein n=1 Tax=Leptothoe spongobia TAU-MAC 1115 TaxID=1967444 RepID=A0A947DF75_9CYAN|nr:hypothetical protein [Leptothoe spongobia]MBT9315800.1 hypothetical protein [Leptothoe spongobia TAU-MAC 1115]